MNDITLKDSNVTQFELVQRQATAWSKSTFVPTKYQNNMPNCLIAIEIANRSGYNPFAVMQNLYVVHGNPSWSAKFLIACFNECGKFSSIKYKFSGEKNTDSWSCTAYTTEKSTGEMIEGPEISIALAKKEGWYDKAGSKWKTIPEMMLRYRAAAWLVNTYAPEISLGFNTRDELEDVYSENSSHNPNRILSVSEKIEALTSAESSEEEAKEIVAETDVVDAFFE